jgi:8-oxo-dGTP pyrophosphatase MutT (NUDIX family)
MTADFTLQIPDIARILGNRPPKILAPQDRGHAAVAMLLREQETSPEVLFIVRAEHDHDPWSGNIGFPGGRLNLDGESAQQAAERETMEELSVDLRQSRYLGRLDDLYGAIMPVLVSCFVYQLQEKVSLQPNHEVARTFWCPLAKLLESDRQQFRTFHYRGAERSHPAVELLAPHDPLLWGITYRLIGNFFSLCNHSFGLSERPPEPRIES